MLCRTAVQRNWIHRGMGRRWNSGRRAHSKQLHGLFNLQRSFLTIRIPDQTHIHICRGIVHAFNITVGGTVFAPTVGAACAFTSILHSTTRHVFGYLFLSLSESFKNAGVHLRVTATQQKQGEHKRLKPTRIILPSMQRRTANNRPAIHHCRDRCKQATSQTRR